MRIYNVGDVNAMSWEEYGAAIQGLLRKIRASGIQFDAVAPIMRSGAIPGNAVAISLGVTKIIPLQFKYLRQPDGLKSMMPMPTSLQRMPAPSNILICENNTSSGNTAQAAIELLKKHFPTSKLCYATVAKVFGGPDSIAGIEEYFFGRLTNERFVATEEEILTLDLRPGVTLFPWEVVKDELNEMN
jgi:hypoxanthine phosphoribosyltransferase